MNNHSLVIVPGFLYYYGFMRHVRRRSQDDEK